MVAFAHRPWPRRLLQAFTPLRLGCRNSGGPGLLLGAVVCRNDSNDGVLALKYSPVLGALSQEAGAIDSMTLGQPCLAPEREKLRRAGLAV